MGKKGKTIAEKAVCAGAAIVADAVRANIDALPAVKDEWGVIAYNNHWSAPLTETAKKGLQDGFGISPMGNEDGMLNVKLGFDGRSKAVQASPKSGPSSRRRCGKRKKRQKRRWRKSSMKKVQKL